MSGQGVLTTVPDGGSLNAITLVRRRKHMREKADNYLLPGLRRVWIVPGLYFLSRG